METRVISTGQPEPSALAVIGAIVLDVLDEIDARKTSERTREKRKESAA